VLLRPGGRGEDLEKRPVRVSGRGTRALFSGMTLGTDGEAATLAARLRAAHDLVGRVLSGHQEARSLLSEASHRRVLAEQSAVAADGTAATADMARLRYEELRHRVDPRAERPLSFWMALVLVVAIGAGLAGLGLIELATLPGRGVAAAAVAAAWIAGAWLAAAAHREGHAGHAVEEHDSDGGPAPVRPEHGGPLTGQGAPEHRGQALVRKPDDRDVLGLGQQGDEVLAVVDVAGRRDVLLEFWHRRAVVRRLRWDRAIWGCIGDGALAGLLSRRDESREKVREVVEGVMPGLPEPQFAIESESSSRYVEKLSGALGDPVR